MFVIYSSTDLKVVLSSKNLRLEATFQWSHDNRYYLTAKSIGNQLSLEVSIVPKQLQTSPTAWLELHSLHRSYFPKNLKGVIQILYLYNIYIFIFKQKPGSSITNNHRFIIKSSNTPGCRDCVTIQSKATSRYMSSGTNGQVVMTTNRKLNTALFSLHTCDPILIMMCGFMDVSCQN
jgi:hypothetical protein